MLIDSQIDHTTGMLMFREGKPSEVYCTEMVKQDFTSGFPLFNMLEHYCTVNHHPCLLMAAALAFPASMICVFMPMP